MPGARRRRSSCLDLLKPCQDRFCLRPDGNKPRMPGDADLTAVSAHGRELKAFYTPRPQIGRGHFRQERNRMPGAHARHLGETRATESEIGVSFAFSQHS